MISNHRNFSVFAFKCGHSIGLSWQEKTISHFLFVRGNDLITEPFWKV